MFAEVLLFTLVGCGLGIITGLIPGIHINTIAAIVLGSMAFLSGFASLSIACMLFAMAVTHTFLDFIPSILFGAPDPDSVLSVLPGHTMLLEGRALEAIKLTGLGSLVSLLITAGFFLVAINFIPALYSVLRQNMHIVLLIIILLGFGFDKKPHYSVFVFILAGSFGFLVLRSNFSQEMLFPALSGLFGVSTLLFSIRGNTELPKQIKAKINLGFAGVLKNSFLGSFAGMLVGLLPGVGAAQATYLAQGVSKGASIKEFLIALSGVNTANIIFTLIVFYTIGKMRSGVVVAIDRLMGTFLFQELLVFLGVILLAGGIAMCLHLFLGSFLAGKLSGSGSRSYGKIGIGIILLIVFLSLLLAGPVGLLILLIGTSIGLVPVLLGARRAHCMGFFLLPVLLFYLGF